MNNLELFKRIGRGHVISVTENFATIEVSEPLKAIHFQEMLDDYNFKLMFPPVPSKNGSGQSADVLIYTFHKLGSLF